MGIFNYNEELASLQKDVYTLKKQMEEVLSGKETDKTAVVAAEQPEPTAEKDVKEEAAAAPPHAGNEPPPTERLEEELRKLAEKIDTAAYQEGIIRDLHQELQLYKKGILEDISKRYATDIINIYERLADMDFHADHEGQPFDATAARRLLENNILYITDLLEDEYSIERFKPEAGSPYKPKEQKAMRTVDTDDAGKANTVAECLSAGFRNEQTGRVLRQARIVVYKLRTQPTHITL